MIYSIAQKSCLGGRNYNEDRTAVFARDNIIFLVIADGLGGHAGGGLASQTLIDAVGDMFLQASKEKINDTERFLSLSINFAHHLIHQAAVKHDYDVHSPKTTCVLALIIDGVMTYAYAGDSRLYLIEKNKILLQTKDHVEKRVKKDAPISRCVGGREHPHPEISKPITLKDNQAILLATDGAWQSFKPFDLYDFVDPAFPDLGLDNLLLELESRNKPPSDNLSIVLMYYGVEQSDVPNISSVQSNEQESKPKQLANDFLDDIKHTAAIDLATIDSTIAHAEKIIKKTTHE